MAILYLWFQINLSANLMLSSMRHIRNEGHTSGEMAHTSKSKAEPPASNCPNAVEAAFGAS